MFRRRRFLAIVALTGLVLWLGSSALVAWTLTRRSRAIFVEPAQYVDWAKIEELRLETSDDQEIGGWLVRGDQQEGCVLLLHGNGESRQRMLPVMQFLANAHFTVLAISLRAHGDSSGEVNDIGWSARHDVIAAVAFLQRECPQQSVFIVGRSLGAAAAIFAAQELGSKVAGYFLEQPYKDLQSAVWNRLQNHLPPVLDWAAYLGLRLWSPVFLPIDPNRISPIEQIAKIPEDVPVMIVTGSDDQHARLSDVRELFGQIEWHAQLIVFDGAAHEPLDRYDPQLYESTLLRFLKRQNPRTVIGVGSSTDRELEPYLSEMPQ
ncbi:MAG: alpha/beta hydrolase [Pirellulaceae bacterium]